MKSASARLRSCPGLDDFTALEFVFAGGRCVMFTDTNGDTVVLRPKPETNLQPIRERLGL